MENFSLITIPRTLMTHNIVKMVIPLIIALVIVYTTIGFKNRIMAAITTLLLYILFYILLDSASEMSVPPQLGLDGISVDNRIMGMMIDHI